MNRVPKSLLECVDDDGSIDEDDCLQLLQNGANDSSSEDSDSDDTDASLSDDKEQKKRKRKKRKTKKEHFAKKRDSSGNLVPLEPRETVWWQLYVDSPPLESKQFHKKFRRRFRMPYVSFQELLSLVKEDSDCFGAWISGVDCTGRMSSPVELLLLGTLRYLGRGFTFDDCEECTNISEETHRRFFHSFIMFGSTVLYRKDVGVGDRP